MNVQRIVNWSRRHPVIAGILAFPVIVILLFLLWNGYTYFRLYSEVRTLERMGISCEVGNLSERQQELGASEELTREFLALCDAISTKDFPQASPRSLRTAQLEEEDLPKFLAEHAEELRAVDRFLDEHPDLILLYDDSTAPRWLGQLSMLNPLREVGRLNYDRFYSALSRNDPAGAVRIFDRSAILRDYALRDSSSVSYLISSAIEATREESLFQAAQYSEIGLFDTETLQRWCGSMSDVETAFRSGFERMLKYELGRMAGYGLRPRQFYRTESAVSEQAGRWMGWIFAPLFRLDAAAAARNVREIALPVAALDYTPETARKLQLLHDFQESRDKRGVVWAPISLSLLPDVLLNESVSRMYARFRLLRTGLAVELFLRKYGRLPEQLNELVPEFLPAVPVNPFTGKPLQIEAGTLEYYRSLTETIETFKGYRIYLDGAPEARPVGLTRTDRYGRIPVWNRAMKLSGGGEGKE